MDVAYRIGVLADTHITDLATAIEFSTRMKAGPFAEVDVILHAGDMVIPDLESCFDGTPVYAVQGNMDASRVGLPLKRILELGRFRVGLIHGWGAPSEVPGHVFNEFSGESLDVLIFGHSHTPFKAYRDERLLFNPGSALDHRGHAERCSVGLLELGQELNARHVYL